MHRCRPTALAELTDVQAEFALTKQHPEQGTHPSASLECGVQDAVTVWGRQAKWGNCIEQLPPDAADDDGDQRQRPAPEPSSQMGSLRNVG